MQPMPAIATGRTVLLILCGLTVASLCVASASAFLAGPGVYCGVVVFDRWGNCLLIEGPHIFYISEKVKSDLLPYQNQAMQLDASDIRQSGSHAQYVSTSNIRLSGQHQTLTVGPQLTDYS